MSFGEEGIVTSANLVARDRKLNLFAGEILQMDDYAKMREAFSVEKRQF